MRNLCFSNSPNWIHHRSGWKYVSDHLVRNLHQHNGIMFYEWADGVFKYDKVIRHDWVGILHNVISYPPNYRSYEKIIYPLEELVNRRCYQESMKRCLRLFTLSDRCAKFLGNAIPLPYPIEESPVKWNRNDRLLVTVGQWMRRYESICKVRTDYKKYILKVPGNAKMYGQVDVDFIDFLSNDNYDELMSRAVVFLDMYDVAACTTISECIMSNTPLLINRHPGVVEILGTDYPMYYDDVQEAGDKLRYVDDAHQYLKSMDKSIYKIDHFIDKVEAATKYLVPIKLLQ